MNRAEDPVCVVIDDFLARSVLVMVHYIPYASLVACGFA
jgi:hypothetical protein